MQKILIVNRLGIGDVVLTTPLAQIIKENLKDVKIGFLVVLPTLIALKVYKEYKNPPKIETIVKTKATHPLE